MDFLTGKIVSFNEELKTIDFEVLKTRKTNKERYNKFETIKIHNKSTKHKLEKSIINCHVLIYATHKNMNLIFGTYQINKKIKYQAWQEK